MRRWKNTSRMLNQKIFEDIMITYSDELAGMGYSLPWREEVIKSCLSGYLRVCESPGSLNRSGKSTQWSRRAKKLVGSRTWFQKSPIVVNRVP